MTEWPEKVTLIATGDQRGYCRDKQGRLFLPGARFFLWKMTPYLIADLASEKQEERIRAEVLLEMGTEQDFGVDQRKWQEWWDRTGRRQYTLSPEE